MSEQVNHPSHYQQTGRRECIQEMCFLFGTNYTAHWAVITAYKYLYRAGAKEGNSYEQDIAKAKWYLDWAENHRSYWTHDTLMAYNAVRKEFGKVAKCAIHAERP